MLYARLENAIRTAPERVWDTIAPVLGDLADGRTRLSAVRHPLGFICLPIVRDDSPEGVCLHYWHAALAAGKPTTSRFHCHSWALLSHVLAGSVGNQRLELVPGDRYRLFDAVSVSRVDLLEPTGTLTDVRCDAPDIYTTGQSYELAAGAFHASVSAYADVSVTLVLGRNIPGAANITLGDPGLGRHEVVRSEMGHDEGRRVAEEILRLHPSLIGAAG